MYSIQQKREDQNSPTLRSLTGQVGRLERQVEALTNAISRMLDENGGGAKGGSKVAMSSSAYTMSTDDMDGSLSSDGGGRKEETSQDDEEEVEEATTEELDDDDGLNLEMQQQSVITSTPTRPNPPSKRPSQLSVLDQIREEE